MACEPTVFVVDDEQHVRETLLEFVRGEGLHARGFASAEDLLAASDLSQAACLVVDLRLPGMQGLELMESLRARNLALPVVIVTGFGDVQSAVRAMKAGAIDFLEKPVHPHALVAAVREGVRRGQEQRAKQNLTQATQAKIAALSDDERDVYRLLVAGYPNKQIATALQIGLRTVELRRSQLLKKMNAGSLPELVRLAILGGLTPEPPPTA